MTLHCWTDKDFDELSWHDNAIHGFRILEGPDNCGGTLVFDIDFILEWLKDADNSFVFRVAPADLMFSQVSDLVISVDYATATAAVQPMAIHEIRREIVAFPTGHTSYKWQIEINWPPNGMISFQADGFSQTLRISPVDHGAQYLSPSEREK